MCRRVVGVSLVVHRSSCGRIQLEFIVGESFASVHRFRSIEPIARRLACTLSCMPHFLLVGVYWMVLHPTAIESSGNTYRIFAALLGLQVVETTLV